MYKYLVCYVRNITAVNKYLFIYVIKIIIQKQKKNFVRLVADDNLT
jgi:hypothetical protein